MRKSLFAALAAAACLAPAGATAQNALNAHSLSEFQLNGTARFMGMAGAFTALGGDLSTLSQNPGGIGVYKMSEVGATMAININSMDAGGNSVGQTKVTCPNFGYIGAVKTGLSVMPNFNWGATYSRAVSFDRHWRGALPLNGSLTNYVAAYTEGGDYPAWALSAYNSETNYDPFYETSSPWLSVLMYNGYGINPTDFLSEDCTAYDGLYNGHAGTASFDVLEHGYVDEYNISFGGNFVNMLSWGVAFGITDIEHTNDTYYSEQFDQARITNSNADGVTEGSARLGLQSWTHMWGSGFNFKAGVIFKPVDEFRIGLAVHTPTYYNMNYEAWAQTDYNYSSGINGWYPGSDQLAPTQNFSWKLRTPMRLMMGLAGVVNRKAIVSFDYEWRPYSHTKVELDNSDHWGPGQVGDFYGPVNEETKLYYRDQHVVRLGFEYRLSQQWSARCGFAYETSAITDEAREGRVEVLTDGADFTGTQPSYVLPRDTYMITLGLGWHYKNFYADAAYVYRHRSADYWCYSNYSMQEADGSTTIVQAPRCDLSESQSRIVLSAGFKF